MKFLLDMVNHVEYLYFQKFEMMEKLDIAKAKEMYKHKKEGDTDFQCL